MVKITLEPAKNGLIKRTVDDNHGGSNEEWVSIDVYEEYDNKLEYIMKFFFDLCEDLGVDLGNRFNKETIVIRKEWGSHYKPSEEDVQLKIKELESQIQSLTKCKTL
jgi:hypothetical protein